MSDCVSTRHGTTESSDDVRINPANPDEWGYTVDYFGTPYNVELDLAEKSGGKELVSTDPNNPGDVYAGATVRRKFEEHAVNPTRENETALWIGHEFSSKGLRTRAAGIPFKDLFQHAFVAGATGSGKSTTLNNIMVQYAYGGWGFCFVDPSGEEWEELLARIPEYRLDDVIYIGPPSGEFDRVTALNLLDVPQYDSEPEARYDARVTQTVTQNLGIIGGTEDMYARMERVLESIQRAMIEADEPYTPLSIYKLLQDEELQEDFTPYINDAALGDNMQSIADLDEDDLEPTIGRLNKWVLNKIARRIIQHPNSSVNISQAVEDGKIIIVNTNLDKVGERIAKTIASAVVQRIWATVQARTTHTSSPVERRPFFLVIDELGDAVTETTPIDTMLQNARKYRLGLTLATQDPAQIPSDHVDSIKANTKTKIIGPLPREEAAEEMAGIFDGVYPEDLQQLPDYNAYINMQSESGAMMPVRTKLFPPYPPLRGEDDVTRVVERSLEKHGVDPDHGIDYDSTMIERVVRGTGAVQTGTVDIDMSEYLTAIDRVELFRGATASGEYVPVEDVADELRNTVAEEFSTRQIEKAIVQLPDSRVATKETSAGVVVSLTDDGRAQARGTDTGDAAAAGGAKHQLLVEEARNLFTRLRCDVTVPDQGFDSEREPDAIAELPEPVDLGESDIETVADVVGIDRGVSSFSDLTLDEIADVKQRAEEYVEEELPARLAEHHDALPVVSNAKHMYVEVESSTNSKFALTLRNLTKAVEDDRRCVFVVRDEDAAKQIIRGVTDPAFCKRVTDDGTRYLYTGAADLTVADEDDDETWRVVREKTGERTRWRGTGTVDSDAFTVDADDEFVLETTSGDEVLRITGESVEERTVPKAAAGAWMRRDRENGVYIVRELQSDGTVSKRVYETKSDFTDEWSPVTRPFVPELMFDRRPTVEDWCVVVLPNDTAAQDGAEPCVFTIEDEQIARETSGDDGVVRTPIRVSGWHGTTDTDTGTPVSEERDDPGDDESGEDAPGGDVGAVGDVDVPQSMIDGPVSGAGDSNPQDDDENNGEDQADAGTSSDESLTPDFAGVSIPGQDTGINTDGLDDSGNDDSAEDEGDEGDEGSDVDGDNPENEMILPGDDEDRDDASDWSEDTGETGSDSSDVDDTSNPVLELSEDSTDDGEDVEDEDDGEELTVPDEEFEALLDDPDETGESDTAQSTNRKDTWETGSESESQDPSDGESEDERPGTTSSTDSSAGQDDTDEENSTGNDDDDEAWMW